MSAPYTVKKGDSLSKIAAQNGVTLSQLIAANPAFAPGGRNINLIQIGESLQIPGATVSPAKSAGALTQPCPQTDKRDNQVKITETLPTVAQSPLEKGKEKGAEIDKRLSDASWLKNDDVAREVVKELSGEDIRNLPASTRNNLMEALNSGYRSSEDKDALEKIYNSRGVDPTFDAADRKRRAAMTDAIKNDATLQKASKNWSSMTIDQRKEALQKTADIQADIYGIPKTSIEFYDKAPYKDRDGKDLFEGGYYNHSDGNLHLNTSDKAEPFGCGFQSFEAVMVTVTHENAHRYQQTIADNFEAGKIPKSDSTYEQARTFSLNDKYYVNEPYDTYVNQPMEQHSRDTGSAAARAF